MGLMERYNEQKKKQGIGPVSSRTTLMERYHQQKSGLNVNYAPKTPTYQERKAERSARIKEIDTEVGGIDKTNALKNHSDATRKLAAARRSAGVVSPQEVKNLAKKQEAAKKNLATAKERIDALEAEKLQLQAAQKTDDVIEKYKISPEKFSSKDLQDWAIKHNYKVVTNGSGEVSLMADKNATQQDKDEMKILRVLVNENATRTSAEMYPTSMSALTVAMAPARGIQGIVSTVEDNINVARGKEIDLFSPNKDLARSTSTTRGTVSEKYASKWFGGKEVLGANLGSTLYNSLMSIGDNAVNMAVGSVVGKAAAGFGASANTVKNITSSITSGLMASDATTMAIIENKKRGLSDKAALVQGMASGLIELATEKWSIEQIISNPKTVLRGVLKSMVAEGSEEMTSEVSNKVIDILANKDNSQLQLAISEYIKGGDSKEEAVKKAWGDMLSDVIVSGVTGLFSGGVMSGVHQGITNNSRRNEINKTNDLIKTINKVAGKEIIKPLSKNASEEAIYQKQNEIGDKDFSALQSNTMLSVFDQNGQKAFNANLREGQNEADYARGFRRMYNLGQSNISLEKISNELNENKYIQSLSPDQRMAAYYAGQNDAKSQLEAERNAVKFVKYYSEDAGIVENDAAKMVDKEELAAIDKLTRTVGAQVVFEEEIEGFNGYVELGKIHISLNAENKLAVVAAHEVVHRMQELAPESYHRYRDFVMSAVGVEVVENYQKKLNEKDIYLSDSEVMDEIAADYTKKILSDPESMQKFIDDALNGKLDTNASIAENRNILQKLYDSIKEFIKKVSEKFSGRKAEQNQAARDVYGVDLDTLKQAKNLLQKALKDSADTVVQMEKQGKAATQAKTEGNVRYSYKGVTKTGVRKYVSDFPTNMPQEKRIALFKERISTIFNLGMVKLKTDVKKIEVKGDKFTYKKNIKGDKKAQSSEMEAKINALYDLADILASSEFEGVEIEESYKDTSQKPKNKAHKDVKYWYKFKNTIIFDGTMYDVTFNIRDKGKEQYQYLIDFKEIKKRTTQVSHTVNNNLRQAFELPSTETIPQKSDSVNTQFMQNSEKNSHSAETVSQLEKQDAKKGFEKTGKKRFSIKMNGKEEVVFERPFSEQVSEVLSKDTDITDGNHVFVCETPSILRQLGLSDLPMLISKGHLRDMNHEEVEGVSKYHGLSEPEINKIPYILENPAMIFKTISEKNPDAICILSNILDSKKRPILISIKPNGKGRYNEVRLESNFILSAYGRNNAQEYLEQIADKSENVMYINKKRTQEMLKGARLQLPAGLSNLRSDIIIHKIDNNVNTQFMQNSEKNSHSAETVSKLEKLDAKKGLETTGKKRFSIKNIPGTDKVYVKADEQVIQSQNPDDWETEIFDYVNRVVRKGKDFVIPLDNEESITITERTAWKLSDKGNFANDYYMVKGNASGVIDEIISVSKYLRSKPPMKTHSDGFARYGFDYRKAYFMDLDGKYYELQLSVGINEEGREAYNIGQIKQVAIPSKRLKGPKGTTTSSDNVSQKSDSVNTQFMQNSENNSQRKNSVKMGQDILEENAALRKINTQLVKRLDELKNNRNRTFREERIATVAKKILKDFDFAYDGELLSNQMNRLSEDTKQLIEGKLDFATFKGKVLEISKSVIEAGARTDSIEYQQSKAMRDYLRTTKISLSEKARNNLGDEYETIRKRTFGRLRLVKDGGTPIGIVYQELSELYPEFFSTETETNASEQLRQIQSVLDGLQSLKSDVFSGYTDEAAEWLSGLMIEKIYNEIFVSGETGKTTVSVDMKAMRSEMADNLQRIMERERQWREREYNKLQDKYEKKTKSYTEARQKSIKIQQIKLHTERLSKALLNPSERFAVPEDLKKPVARFLSCINLENDRLSEKTIGTLGALMSTYRKIAEQEYEVGVVLDPQLAYNIEDISDAILNMEIEEKRVSDLDLATLEKLRTSIMSMETMLRNYNQTFREGNRKRIDELASAAFEEIKAREKKIKKNSKIGAVKSFSDMLNFDMINPWDYFHQMGGTFEELFGGLRDGENKQIKNLAKSKDYLAEITEKYNISQEDISDKNLKTFSLENGQTIELSKSQVMSLYLLWRQEQTHEHMTEGGIRPAKVSQKLIESKNGKRQIEMSISEDYNAVRVNLDDVAAILDTLTDNEKKFAESISDFFVNECAAWGNEVALKLFGYKKFNAENYFPIVSDKMYLQEDFGVSADATIKNMGITKKRIKHANNPIIIEDIFEVYARHVSDMAKYNAYVLPLQDIQRVFNYVHRTDEEFADEQATEEPNTVNAIKDGEGIKALIATRYGKQAVNYFSKLMVDINMGINNQYGNALSSGLISSYKKAKMGLNARVVIQQPVSYIRAAALIDPKYLTKAVGRKVDIDTVFKYSPIAQWKSWGFFSTDTGKDMYGLITGQKDLADYTMALAGKADEMTWKRIWAAVELETADLNPDLQKGSEAFYEVCGKRFDEIVDRTQVVDSTLHRSQALRSPDGFTKMAYSFMSEPLKTYNLLRSAVVDAVSLDDAKSKKALAGTITVCAVSSIVLACVTGAFDALTGDEEDEFLKNFEENLLGDALGMLPYVKDIYSVARGFSVERMDMQGLSDVVNAVMIFSKDSYTWRYKTINLLTKIAEMGGIPVGSFKKSIYDLVIKNIFKGTDGHWMSYNIAKQMYPVDGGKKGELLDILFDAYSAGNKRHYNKIVKDMIKSGLDAKTIEGGLKSRFKKSGIKETFAVPWNKNFELPETEQEDKFGIADLTETQYTKYQSTATALNKEISADIKRMRYDMPENDYQKRLKAAYEYSVETALEEAARGKYESEKSWVNKAQTAEEKYGLDPADFIMFYKYYNDITPPDGQEKFKQGQKKQLIIDYLDGMELTAEEWRYLYSEVAGYKK